MTSIAGNMAKFSIRSLKNLSTCHPDLQVLCHEAIKEFNFSVICGHRNEADQNKAYSDKKSTFKWPDSKHNSLPSEAVDITPYPLDWLNIRGFERLNAVMEKKAKELGIKIRWGGNFKKLRDYVHYELV